MHRLTIKSNSKREILDITERVEAVLRDQYADDQEYATSSYFTPRQL